MFAEYKDFYINKRLQCILVHDDGHIIRSDQTLFPISSGESIDAVHPLFESLPFADHSTEKDIILPCVHLQKDGQEWIVDIGWQTHPQGTLIFIHDLSEHYKEYQRAAQLRNESIIRAERAAIENLEFEKREKFKNAFIRNFSHEIRNPLTGITAITEVLGNTELTDEQKKMLEYLRDTNLHLRTLLEDILCLNLIASGRLRLQQKEYNLYRMLELLEFSFNAKAGKKGLLFETAFDPEIPERVEGDRTRLFQVLSNLLENAVKFTEKGRIKLEVDCHQKWAHKASLRFRITDTGPGIPPEMIPKIFESFNRIDHREDGTGLGLSIVRGLLEEMGSQITVESSPGEGSTFFFDLLLRFPGQLKSKGQPQTNETKYFTPKGFRSKTYRVLYVEDDERLQLVVLKWLMDIGGLRVDIAEDGARVIEQLLSEPYDLLLLDVNLPNLSGEHIARLIREIPVGNMKTLPIIGLTAFAFKDDVERLLEAGMNTVLSKPFDEKTLQQTIEQFLRQPV